MRTRKLGSHHTQTTSSYKPVPLLVTGQWQRRNEVEGNQYKITPQLKKIKRCEYIVTLSQKLACE